MNKKKEIKKPFSLSKWVFIVWNVLIVWWFASTIGLWGNSANDCVGEFAGACAAGTAIGAGLGIIFIFFIWVVGNITIYLFKRMFS